MDALADPPARRLDGEDQIVGLIGPTPPRRVILGLLADLSSKNCQDTEERPDDPRPS